MDVLTMATVVQNGLMQRSCIFTVSVMLPDKPGQLAAVSSLIAKEQSNVIKLEHNVFANVNRYRRRRAHDHSLSPSEPSIRIRSSRL